MRLNADRNLHRDSDRRLNHDLYISAHPQPSLDAQPHDVLDGVGAFGTIPEQLQSDCRGQWQRLWGGYWRLEVRLGLRLGCGNASLTQRFRGGLSPGSSSSFSEGFPLFLLPAASLTPSGPRTPAQPVLYPARRPAPQCLREQTRWHHSERPFHPSLDTNP